MCPECNGLGTRLEVDPELFYDPDKTINEGAVAHGGDCKKGHGGRYRIAKQIVEQFGHNLDTKWKDSQRNARMQSSTRCK
jgi:excinuclease ABC subunit A